MRKKERKRVYLRVFSFIKSDLWKEEEKEEVLEVKKQFPYGRRRRRRAPMLTKSIAFMEAIFLETKSKERKEERKEERK